MSVDVRCRAAILHGARDVRIEEISVPAPRPGEVRVRIQTALTCGTDVKVYRRGGHPRMISPPSAFGHEFAGIIDAVGHGVTAWAPGQRVTAANSAPCGDCFHCARDQPALCEDLLFVNGAYAGYLNLPARLVESGLIAVPDEVPLTHAAMVEPLACVVQAVQESGIEAGQSVVVLGAGPIGLLFVSVCADLGAHVFAAARRANHLLIAEKMGASASFVNEAGVEEKIRRASNHGRGPDHVIECTGAPEIWEQAVRLVRRGGCVNLFGGCQPGSTVTLDTARIHYDSLTIRSTFHHSPSAVRRALTLICGRRIPCDLLIAEEAPLEELPRLLAERACGSGGLKAAISPWSGTRAEQ